MNSSSYTVKALRGLYISFDTKGEPMVTSRTEEECCYWSERYLTKAWDTARVVNDGVVGGKL